MTEATARYVILRVGGRGRRIFHLIDRDGSTPLCGARLVRGWDIGRPRVGWRKCDKCKRKEERP